MSAYETAPRGIDQQPVAGVSWRHRDELHANDYNPNHVAPPELELLKVSILADGWTQPIVARSSGEIVDGFHRWTVAGDPEVGALTDGMVPVVVLRDVPPAHQKGSTVRHNRARGAHGVLKMSDIVRVMIDEHGLTRKQVADSMGMEREEVERLYDVSGMAERAGVDEFSKAWVPDDVEPDDPAVEG